MTDSQPPSEHESADEQHKRDPAAGQPDRQHSVGRNSGREGSLPDEQRVIRGLTWGALGIACVVAIGALHQFYFNAAAAIETFVATEYESLFLAGFNLIVLFVAGVVISLLVRELAAGGEADGEATSAW